MCLPFHDQSFNIFTIFFFQTEQELVIGKNFFNSLPTEIGNLVKLRNLAANDNLFEGKVKSFSMTAERAFFIVTQ